MAYIKEELCLQYIYLFILYTFIYAEINVFK
jgi:hypothetical protein